MVLQTDKDHVTPGSFHVLQPKNPSRIFLDLRTRSQLCPRRHCRPTPATFSSLHRLPCLAFNTAFDRPAPLPTPCSPEPRGGWAVASGDRTGSRPRARCALPALERRPTAPCPWRGAPDAEPEPGTEHTRTPPLRLGGTPPSRRGAWNTAVSRESSCVRRPVGCQASACLNHRVFIGELCL